VRLLWPAVSQALQSVSIEESDGKFQVFAQGQGGRVRLGKKSNTRPTYDYRLEEVTVSSNSSSGDSSSEVYVARQGGVLCIEQWRESFYKLSGVPDANKVGYSDWALLADVLGTAKHSPCTVEWLHSLQEDGMVNSFEGRSTL
jgi:hypothetical protein